MKPYQGDGGGGTGKICEIFFCEPNFFLDDFTGGFFRIYPFQAEEYFSLVLDAGAGNEPREHFVFLIFYEYSRQPLKACFLAQAVLEDQFPLEAEDRHQLADISIIIGHFVNK